MPGLGNGLLLCATKQQWSLSMPCFLHNSALWPFLQACWALGNLASVSIYNRDLVLREGALLPLLDFIASLFSRPDNTLVSLPFLQTATWVLYRFFQGTTPVRLEVHSRLCVLPFVFDTLYFAFRTVAYICVLKILNTMPLPVKAPCNN